MILTEWNTDDAIAFAREEGREEGREDGLEEGLEKGRENGREEEKLEIAKNLLSKGSTVEFVNEITGLDIKTIQKFSLHIAP